MDSTSPQGEEQDEQAYEHLGGQARSALSVTPALAQTTLTIATVNNNDMIVMQKLSKTFESQHPDIKLNWVTLEENILRQRLTTDIGTQGGQFDVLTIGLFEAPMWGHQGWLSPFDKTPAAYRLDDVLKSVRDGPLGRREAVRAAVSTPKAR